MCRLERGDDALGAAEELERVEHLGVGDRVVLGPLDLGEVGVLGSEAGVVETGRDRLGLEHLPHLVLHEVRLHPVHDRRDAVPGRGAAGGLGADQADRRVVGESGEQAGGVRATTDAGDGDIGQAAGQLVAPGLWPRSPMISWKVRTIHGYGCGPITEPRQ